MEEEPNNNETNYDDHSVWVYLARRNGQLSGQRLSRFIHSIEHKFKDKLQFLTKKSNAVTTKHENLFCFNTRINEIQAEYSL